MNRAYYSQSISGFLDTNDEAVLGILLKSTEFAVEQTQRDAWLREITILRTALTHYEGSIYLEYSIPRMGGRIDAVLLIGPTIFVLEFKVGAHQFRQSAVDQVIDYALDLKNFHEPSHARNIVPILIATDARDEDCDSGPASHGSGMLWPIRTNERLLRFGIQSALESCPGLKIDPGEWESGRYCPTPTIIEAALALIADTRLSISLVRKQMQ